MVTVYQCLKCGAIIPEGGVICKPVGKCPKCGSWIVVPALISPRFWWKRFAQSQQ